MNPTLRLRIAQDYLTALAATGEVKQALLEIMTSWGVSRSSIYAYLKESRSRTG